MKNNRKDLPKYIGAIYQTCNRSYLSPSLYFDEYNLLFNIDFDLFHALFPFFGISRFIKFSTVKEKFEF